MSNQTANQETKSKHIFIVTRDNKFSHLIEDTLNRSGFICRVFDDLSSLKIEIGNIRDNKLLPNIVIMGLTYDNEPLDSFEFIKYLKQIKQDCQIIACCKQGELERRLKAIHAGAARYFQAPVNVDDLLDAVRTLTISGETEAYRAVIVDDQKTTLFVYAHMLSEAGFEVAKTTNPLDTLDLVKLTKPDVIVLDVNMPEVGGYDIASILKADKHYSRIPIYFLSGEDSIDSRLQGLSVGAEGFFSKPVDKEEFTYTLYLRARRYRQSMALAASYQTLKYEREREFEAINQHVIMSIADRKGNITEVNDKFCEISGYTRQELIGNNHRIVKSGQHPEQFYKTMWQTIAKGEAWNGTICNQKKNGDFYWVYTTIQPFLDAQERIYKYVSVRTDITELKNTLASLTQTQKVAMDANKAKSEFLANMSHELRTPLNAIQGFSQLLQLDDGMSEDNKESVGEIVTASKHLLSLINEVLDLSKLEAGQMTISTESVAIDKVCSEVLSMTRNLANTHNISVQMEPNDSIKCICDKGKLRQILLNFVSNSIKYNTENGSVKIGYEQDGDLVRVWVKDTGVGIAEEHLDDLFQPFNRLGFENSGVQGTGIGLNLTQKLAELMGGSVVVESEVGVGSTFSVELPFDSGGALQSEVNNMVVPERDTIHSNQVKKLIYIDDNEVNLKLLKQAFKKYETIDLAIFSDPEEGINAILEADHDWDLILLDINMPVLSGFDVLRTIKQISKFKDVLVVGISANAMSEDIQKAKDAGFTEYFTKPLQLQQFKDYVFTTLFDADSTDN